MTEVTFYARSGGDESPRLQELRAHLQAVAERAADAAGVFHSAPWGQLLGLWHDLGKYRPEFQAKLLGENLQVEHSGLGASLCYSIDPVRALPIAFAIAGHHTGLANLHKSDNGQPLPLMERIRANATLLETLSASIPADLLKLSLPPLPNFLELSTATPRNVMEWRRRFELWTRFLFSTLVDADRLDAEAFDIPERTVLRAPTTTIVSLRQRLDNNIREKLRSIPETDRMLPLNQARAHILDSCREAAEATPGIFSLTVPTGGGKTLSGMAFALKHAERHGLRRVIVVMPYTSIIEQNARVYREALGPESVLEHHSNLDPDKELQAYGHDAAQRTALAAENWDAPVVVTTTVQFFESLLSNRPSRCRKVHNVARSVIVLDEVQTLPPGFLLSILDVLTELVRSYGCSVVLSTATPPALAARPSLPQGLSDIRPIVSDPQRLYQDLARVRYEWPDPDAPPRDWDELVDDVAQCHSEQVLAVLHTRADARQLALALRGRVPADSVFHLSALMCPAHRSALLAVVRQRLAQALPCRLVATQLIEAGVDLDFPVVYRALAGLDSLVQAAGRCNREGRLAFGRFVVFRAPTLPPPGILRHALHVMESLLQKGDPNPDDPTVCESYFRAFYQTQHLDARAVQTHRQELNFASTADAFRLIDDSFVHPVVVPWGEGLERIERLRKEAALPTGPTRATLRALQPFTVNVYETAFASMFRLGMLDEVAPGVHALARPFAHCYDQDLGLTLGDSPAADPGALVV